LLCLERELLGNTCLRSVAKAHVFSEFARGLRLALGELLSKGIAIIPESRSQFSLVSLAEV
jgi:hypothetical protein